MIDDLINQAGLAFLVLCRTGTALMLLPAFSSPRFPPSIRLFLALALSVALTPLVGQRVLPPGWLQDLRGFAILIAGEIVLGLAIGAMGSFFLHAARFAGEVISNCIGLGGIPGQPIEGNDPLGHIATLLSLAVAFVIFVTDLHLQSIHALISTYDAIQIGDAIDPQWLASSSTGALRDSFSIALQIASPFIAYSLLANLVVGLVGRVAPKVQIYFSITGIMAIFGMLLLLLAAPQTVTLIPIGYGQWLESISP